jgi:hypothetical protein
MTVMTDDEDMGDEDMGDEDRGDWTDSGVT